MLTVDDNGANASLLLHLRKNQTGPLEEVNDRDQSERKFPQPSFQAVDKPLFLLCFIFFSKAEQEKPLGPTGELSPEQAAGLRHNLPPIVSLPGVFSCCL